MKFGDVPIAAAEGAYLAHSQRTEKGVIRKGTRLDGDAIKALSAAGVTVVTVARLGPQDVHENDAARRVATAAAGDAVHVERADTGRANLVAASDGLAVVDVAAVNRLNGVDPAVTLATLNPFTRVSAGRMVGTVKIIPFAAPEASVTRCEAAAGGAVKVVPWSVRRVAAISTLLPALKPSVVGKTLSIFGERIAAPGATLSADRRVDHAVEPLSEAIAAADGEVVVVFGASAVVDGEDVIPAAIRAAGGHVIHLGMPVDPGNLLVLGEQGGRPVIGAPGCARSPKPNGFDMVLDRVLAGLPVVPADIVGMGVGGLLEETAARPRPRRGVPAGGAPKAPAAIVLAAGRSTRMGERNKLLEPVGGTAMVRSAVAAALGSRCDPVVVVTGHEADKVAASLSGLNVIFAHNTAFRDGLSTSLKAGLNALPETADAALVVLADMPLITAEHCDRVLDGLSQDGALIALAGSERGRGNPVAWSNRLFPELKATDGDAGGRALLSRYGDQVVTVPIGAAAAADADTPEALEAVRAEADQA